jgi:hypothetical protein
MEAHMNFATEPTNHAVGIHEFGGPSVVGVIERAIPRPLSDEVLVRVHAATVNPTDTLFRTGAQTGRMAGLAPPFTPGMEFAGQVVDLGNVQGDLPEFQVGTEWQEWSLPGKPGEARKRGSLRPPLQASHTYLRRWTTTKQRPSR